MALFCSAFLFLVAYNHPDVATLAWWSLAVTVPLFLARATLRCPYCDAGFYAFDGSRVQIRFRCKSCRRLV